MLYWTDTNRGMNEIPFDFEKVGVDCELFKKNACPFVKKPSRVCSKKRAHEIAFCDVIGESKMIIGL